MPGVVHSPHSHLLSFSMHPYPTLPQMSMQSQVMPKQPYHSPIHSQMAHQSVIIQSLAPQEISAPLEHPVQLQSMG